jgi:hypothetical protein
MDSTHTVEYNKSITSRDMPTVKHCHIPHILYPNIKQIVVFSGVPNLYFYQFKFYNQSFVATTFASILIFLWPIRLDL